MIVPRELENDIRREIKELIKKGYKQYHIFLDPQKIFGITAEEAKNARTKSDADKA